MLFSLSLSVFFATAAPMAVPASDVLTTESPLHQPKIELVADAGERSSASDKELSLVEKFFPLTLSKDLHPDVDDNLILMWIVTAVLAPCASPVWMPFAFGIDVPNEYFVDGLILWLSHIGLDIAINATAGALSWLFGFVGGFVPGFGFLAWVFPVMANAFVFIDWIYLTPVATINLINYHAKKQQGKTGTAQRRRKDPPTFADRNAAGSAFAY